MNAQLRLDTAAAAFRLLNATYDITEPAAYVANLLGDDGTTAYPIDSQGTRRYRPDPLGSGVPIPLTVPELIVELMFRRTTWQNVACWGQPYGWTPSIPSTPISASYTNAAP